MGSLFIVATPIGNLKDITFRAIATLKIVDYILCEDTRVAGKLLSHYDIKKKLESFNEFNEDRKESAIIKDLLAGKSIALVSDAGTPLVSDPGYKLVRESVERGIKVEAIPGPSAVTTALILSGLPPDKFLFLGYLPKKEGKRKEMLKKAKEMRALVKSTFIVYESPHRLIKTLTDIKVIFGNLDVAVCRELTKMHEEVRREKVSLVTEHYVKDKVKGEVTILF